MDTVPAALPTPVPTTEALPPDFYVLQAVRELFKSGWLTKPGRMVRSWGMWFGWQCGSLYLGLLMMIPHFKGDDILNHWTSIYALLFAAALLVLGPILASYWIRGQVIDMERVRELARQIAAGRFEYQAVPKKGWRLWRVGSNAPRVDAPLSRWICFISDYLDVLAAPLSNTTWPWLANVVPLLACMGLTALLMVASLSLPSASAGKMNFDIGYLMNSLVAASLIIYMLIVYPIYSIVRLNEFRLVFCTALLQALPASSFEPELRQRMDELVEASARPAVANCRRPRYLLDFIGGFMLLFVPIMLGIALVAGLLYFLGHPHWR